MVHARIVRALLRPFGRFTFRTCALFVCALGLGAPAPGDDQIDGDVQVEVEKVNWLHDYSKGVHESAACKRPMVIIVGAKWCGYCRKLYEQTLPNPGIISLLNEQFVPVMLDADKEPELTQKLKVQSMPTVIVVSPERKILRRIAGFKSPAELNAQLTPFKKKLSSPAMAAN